MEIIESQRKYLLSSFSIFILFIVSMNHWIGWSDRGKYIYAITGLLLWFAFQQEKVKTRFSLRYIWPCVVLYFIYLYYDIGWAGDPTSSALYTNVLIFLIPLLLLICVEPLCKKVILVNITKMYAVLMLAALVVYFISLFVDLPSLGIIEFSKTIKDSYAPCENYFFLTVPVENLSAAHHSFLRFQGPFIEPGHVGMICAFLLFSNKFDFTPKSNIVILISLLVTFSLAGYMLALIGYMLILFSQKRLGGKSIFVMAGLLLILITFGVTYNGGDNFINESILSRLQADEDRGFSGNNRTGLYVMYMFSNMFDNIQTALYGYDAITLKQLEDEVGVGLVWFLVHHGIIGLMVVLFFYFVEVRRAYDKRYAYMYLLFLLAVFFQRNYPFWFSWLICFDYGIQVNDYEKKQCAIRQ